MKAFLVSKSNFTLVFIFVLMLNVAFGQTKIEGIHYLTNEPVSIEIRDGQIVDIQPLEKLSDESHVVYVAPGFIDAQINGYMGKDFSASDLSIEDVRIATKALWKEGITSFFPTITSFPDELIEKNFGILAKVMDDPEIGLSIPGFHLEGPYISPVSGYRGDHPEEYIRKPDWEEFKSYQEAARGAIKLITVAPEIEGAIPFIRHCVETGVVVAIGHTNASAEIIEKAVYAGASMSTHLGNGCANEINRHQNPLWPQLSNDALIPSIIADGCHLTKEEVRTFFKVKGADHLILVSDAVDLAGMPPGEYVRGGHVHLLTSRVVKYPAENVLAGAASPIRLCVENIMKFTGCSLSDAVHTGSTNVAKQFGLSDRGEIALGKRADLIIFSLNTDELNIEKTYVAGKLVYQAISKKKSDE